MRRAKIICLLLLLSVISIAGWQVLVFSNKLAERTSLSQQAPSESPETASFTELPRTAILVVDDGSGSPRALEVTLNATATAFSLLKQLAANSGLKVESKNYDIGVFIEAIGQKKNGEEGKYWLYYINGEMPQVAADKQIVKPGDKVEFKFEKYNF